MSKHNLTTDPHEPRSDKQATYWWHKLVKIFLLRQFNLSLNLYKKNTELTKLNNSKADIENNTNKQNK